MRFRAMKKKNQKKRTYIRRFSKLGLIMRLTQVAMKRLTQVLLTYVKLAFIKLSILSPLYTYSYAVLKYHPNTFLFFFQTPAISLWCRAAKEIKAQPSSHFDW